MTRNRQLEAMYRAQEQRDRQRCEKLRRLVAAEHARFGAQGHGSLEGSAAALISGLRKRTENEIAIDHRTLQTKRTDLLAASRPTRRGTGWMLVQSFAGPMVNLLEK